MAILIDQRFPSCTLCGKMLPLRAEPIVRGAHRLCSQSCLKLLLKRTPDAGAPQSRAFVAHAVAVFP